MASLFLSYSREDVGRVRSLAAALERDGHEVWWDQYISGGQEFADEIEKALNSADAVIVCWTANSIRSPGSETRLAQAATEGGLFRLL